MWPVTLDGRNSWIFVEEIFGRYLSLTPIQTANALVVAASEEDIYLDCVYFLIRREPNILVANRSLSLQAEEGEHEEQRNTDWLR